MSASFSNVSFGTGRGGGVLSTGGFSSEGFSSLVSALTIRWLLELSSLFPDSTITRQVMSATTAQHPPIAHLRDPQPPEVPFPGMGWTLGLWLGSVLPGPLKGD